MANYAKDEFIPKNPEKYSGKYPIIYRSSWEMTLMNVFDNHPNVLTWQSESLSCLLYTSELPTIYSV